MVKHFFQYERAAAIYRQLRLPIATSRCYEQQGIFNKAVEVLIENEIYSIAIDTLKRYEMRVKVERHFGSLLMVMKITYIFLCVKHLRISDEDNLTLSLF